MLSSYSRGLERGRRMAGGTGSSRRNVSGSADGGNGPGPRRPTDHPDGTGELP
jgi:hypothetical protein